MSPFSPREKFRTSAKEIPRRVLVVDEEPLVCWAVCEGLEREGFSTVFAESGIAAIAVAGQNEPPDVVVIDGRLHDMSPAVLIFKLQAGAPDCRFIVMTTECRDLAIPTSDRVSVLHKPFDMAEIVSRVTAAATVKCS